MALSDYSTTAASNTSIGGIGIAGSNSVNLGDNVMRQIAADIKAGVITGYTTTATAAGTTTLTVASNSYQYFTGSTTQTVVMPVTSTLELGRAWVIVNNSTGALTVNSSGANLITTVAAGSVAIVQCILLTGTSAASWDAKTITLALASAAEWRTGTDTTKVLGVANTYAAAAEVTLTDAATITVDGSTFLNAVVTLTDNRTLGTWSNPKVGQSGYIRVVQDGTGSRTLAYHADYEFAGGTAIVLTTTASAQDMIFYQVIASGRVLLSAVKAIA